MFPSFSRPAAVPVDRDDSPKFAGWADDIRLAAAAPWCTWC